MLVHVVTHPEVRVEPEVPAPQWALSDAGRDRLRHLLAQPWVPRLARVVASPERTAVETAAPLAASVGLRVAVDAGLREHPEESGRSEERAQARVVAAAGRAVAGADGDVALVCHGGVGTLLLCALLGVPADRRLGQPGEGSVFAYDPVSRRVASPWVRLGPPD
ncbi:histidine phosphatase family protein [Geodermatophilus sp. URMC 62]|uniref:histidine phosphatase family protein n=1 Tax=Geodermatophilus sp. URMC 62 TaxID=3423414 RepID=UPI00406D2524